MAEAIPYVIHAGNEFTEHLRLGHHLSSMSLESIAHSCCNIVDPLDLLESHCCRILKVRYQGIKFGLSSF